MGFQCPNVRRSVSTSILAVSGQFLKTVAASSKRPSGEGTTESQPAKKPRKAKPYVPTLRSGPYALILALATLDENSSQGLTKTQLIEIAQPNCDSSFTAPSDTSKFHTAWSSMKTLLQKEFVYDFGRPLKKYALTEEGWEVAKRMKKVASSSDQGTLAFGNQSVGHEYMHSVAILF